MKQIRKKGEKIRKFIVTNVAEFPKDIARVTAEKFDISRQAVNKHLKAMVEEGSLERSGSGTRNISYELAPLEEWNGEYVIDENLREDRVWRDDIAPLLDPHLSRNGLDIWHYGFTEIFNNAIDHSEGSAILVKLERDAVKTSIIVFDDGIGIFNKIQKERKLDDPRHAIFELTKGKLTTDPRNHSGQGIFFTSRMLDHFAIDSNGLCFFHRHGAGFDSLMKSSEIDHYAGTFVKLELDNHVARTVSQVFREYTTKDADKEFSKTLIPVKMAEYGDDKLVSRSQAKRVLTGLESFKLVMFDFAGVDMIGQGFADEMFRVFPLNHPDVLVIGKNANSDVSDMVQRAGGKVVG